MTDLTLFYGTMESGKTTKLLQDNYNYTSAKPNEQKAIEWYRENLEINLDSNEAACFTKS